MRICPAASVITVDIERQYYPRDGALFGRPLTRLSGGVAMRTFDITSEGKRIVFDRVRENSSIVLIDLAR
jgi:hypothetical protein